VSVEDCALLAKKMDDFDRITALPEKMTQVTVSANFLTGSFTQLH
jgi:hypothetical protein